MTNFRPIVLLVLLSAAPWGAQAQQNGLAFLLSDLLGVVVLDNNTHEAHFTGEDQLNALNSSFVSALGPQLATVPLGSPGGGLTFTFDEATGVFTRSSQAFGSIYSERALTVGRSKWNAGVSFQSAEYDSFGEFRLGGGDVEFQLRHQDVAPIGEIGNPELEEDVIGAGLDIHLSTDTTVFFFTYGITDRFDVSVAVPYVQTDLSARADLTIRRLESICESNSPDPVLCPHRFGQSAGSGVTVTGPDTAFVGRGGSASGVGDVLLRGKYRFREAPGGGMAFGFDLRLATGEEEELIGTGGTQTRIFLIGSREWGKLSPYFNVGYTFSSAGGDVIQALADEVGYTFGLLYAATPRVTIGADLIGRQLLDAPSLVRVLDDLDLNDDGEVLLPNVAATTRDIDILLGALGVRFNPRGNFLVSINVLTSLSNDGLEDEDLVPVVALDYSF